MDDVVDFEFARRAAKFEFSVLCSAVLHMLCIGMVITGSHLERTG